MNKEVDLDKEIREILERSQAADQGAALAQNNIIIGNRGVVIIIGGEGDSVRRRTPTQDQQDKTGWRRVS